MLEQLKDTANITFTENGALAYVSSGCECLDLFFRSGAMRNAKESEIENAVIRAYAEDPDKTMKILFFARDVRGGLGERRFFRCAMRTLAEFAPVSVIKNISLFAEYGRYDDLCVLLDTDCSKYAAEEIKKQLYKDIKSMNNGGKVSLLAKWLPSVNASSPYTVYLGKILVRHLGMDERTYRRMLSKLRKYCDILENRLRVKDYTFDYSKQPSRAMMKYSAAFIRNDKNRYLDYLSSVQRGDSKLNASVLYPYDIVRRCFDQYLDEDDKKALDVTWRSLNEHGRSGINDNAIAVVDCSGSMTCGYGIRPIDIAISLGIYFAEHNTGAFGGHFISFSKRPNIIEIKGKDICEKVRYCASYNEVANTDIESVFELILKTAVKNKLSDEDMLSRIYIISDMQFDACVLGGNNETLFETMKRRYAKFGYSLPDVIFWNVNSKTDGIPVCKNDTGTALVSGMTPAIFDMVRSGDMSPEKIMNDVIESKRYEAITA